MNKSDKARNLYQLKGPLAKNGYDWWWHNFTGINRETGASKAFFIEYFVCNPDLGHKLPVLGQLPENKAKGIQPSYALMKVGTWGKESKQIHNFYPIKSFSSQSDVLNISFGECQLTETHMSGHCKLTEEEVKSHPEYMCDAGEMKWDIEIDKKIAYHVGYGASSFFRKINAFEMFWHAEGMKTEYAGVLELDGVVYDIVPEKSYGYADKNWGGDFTSPWLWISSCNMKSLLTGKALENTVVEFGGGKPKVFGMAMNRKLLGGFYYEGKSYDHNFSKFWLKSSIQFEFEEGEVNHTWRLHAKNRDSELELILECPRDEMLLINYEAPSGKKRHNRLWNGGTGFGTIKLYQKQGQERLLVDEIAFANAGCEYGEYDA